LDGNFKVVEEWEEGRALECAGMDTFVGQCGDGGAELRAVGFGGFEFGLGVVKLRL
jgi:hypothetical protein